MYLLIFISIIIGILIGLTSFYFINKWWTRRGYISRAQIALFAEKEAEELLKRNGFEILGKQARENVITYVDGKSHLSYVQADYRVKRKGKIYIAEVKCGEIPPDPTEPATRRQLLEYDYVFRPDGLLLVDMNEKRIHEVGFKFPKERDLGFYFQFIIALLVIASVTGIIWLMVWLKLF